MIDGSLSREQMEILARSALNALSFSVWIPDKSRTLQEQSFLLYEHATHTQTYTPKFELLLFSGF